MSKFNRSTTGNEVVDGFADRVRGRTVVITGPTDGGLGSEAAVSCARGHPAKIFLLGRTAAKIEPVIHKIRQIDDSIDALFVPVELDNLDSVRNAAAIVNDKVDKIDYLLNNAGVMGTNHFTLSKQGVELQFAVNHLSHFLLTNLLFPKILAAGEGARIVNVTSNGYRLGPVRFDDYNFSDGKAYEKWTGYGQSKTAQILFTRRLAAKVRGKGVGVLAAHPGVIIETGLAVDVPWEDFAKLDDVALKNTGRPFNGETEFKSLQAGVSTALVALLDPGMQERTGSYLEDCNVTDVYEYAQGAENEDKLWTLSENLTREAFTV